MRNAKLVRVPTSTLAQVSHGEFEQQGYNPKPAPREPTQAVMGLSTSRAQFALQCPLRTVNGHCVGQCQRRHRVLTLRLARLSACASGHTGTQRGSVALVRLATRLWRL
jgi:hypothetical protein